MPPSRGRIIVGGILFWFPLAGVTCQFLHYLVGLRRLGFDVYYLEDCSRWVYDPHTNDISGDASSNVAAVAPVLEAFGFADRWAFRGPHPDIRCYGMTNDEIKRLYREADVLLNVTAAQEIGEDQFACPRRIYIESDPFAAQVKAAEGDAEVIAALSAHDTHFTFGENVGSPACDLPSAGFSWLPTRQPVVVDLWEHSGDNGSPGAYTTVATWHNDNKDVTFRGETFYWTKDREFTKFIDLPQRRPEPFELAVGSDAEELLSAHGWRRADCIEISSSLERYRSYIQHSRGEFTVARDQYVRPHTGWFSDRSACYLAAGRPVIMQDTGFGDHLPTGEGLFGFATTDDVLAALDEIESDYERHCRAAHEIAREYFRAEVVLGDLLHRAGL